ncbi:solute carrier family 3 (zinc transporter), member 2 [Nematocida displodere]|uniref:Solute carrier family 3 (Zinc transporter), member 2 n=1 Tax=Nematocida displodere TaxID=1805483 RepID=A0A177ECI8_9MICR|nr:solute carrier family 3 (zinc transporter), member 2 [Nematocida displodere]
MKHSYGMYVVLVNTVILMVAEILAHKHSNAVSVLGEAFHMVSDLCCVCISIISSAIVRRVKAGRQYTFGLARLEVLSAGVSLAFLWVPSIYLLYLSLTRFLAPESVDREILLWASFFSLGINLANFGVSLYMNKTDMHAHSLYVHIVSDLMQSLGMCISAIALFINNTWVGVDLACTVICTLIGIGGSLRLGKDVFMSLMDVSPLSVEEVKAALLTVPAVESVDDLRVWSVNKRTTVAMAKVSIFHGESYEESLARCKSILDHDYAFALSNVEIKTSL